MVTAILVLSVANLLLNIVAVYQRHQTIQLHKQNGESQPLATNSRNS